MTGHKRITLDFRLYQEELSRSEDRGYWHGLNEAQKIFMDILNNKSLDDLDFKDDDRLRELALKIYEELK